MSKKSKIHKRKPHIKVQASKKSSFLDNLNLNSNHLFLGILVLASIFIFIVRWNFLEMPFERDEGDYALAGKLLLEGGRPYVDFFEQKPPGLFYSYAAVEALFGATIRGLHMGFIFVSILSMFFIAYAAKYLFNPLAGAITGVVFGVLTLNPFASGFTVQAEHLLNLFVCSSLFFLFYGSRKEKLWPIAVSGLLVAWSATIKQNGIFFIAAIVIGVLCLHLSSKKLDIKQLLKQYTALAIGGFSAALIILLLMLLNGVWKEFLFWAIEFPRETYVSEIPLSQGMEYFKGYYKRISGHNPWIWYGGMAGLLLMLTSRLKLWSKVWIISLVVLALLSISPGNRFYGHYWLHLFIGLSIAFGSLVFGLQDLLERRFKPTILVFTLSAVFLVFFIADLKKNKKYYFEPDNPALIKRIYGSNPFMETYNIAEILKKRGANKQDKLLVLGSEPQLHFQTGMESPTPHTFIAFTAGPHPRARTWREEYISMMKKNEAKYAVFVVHPFSWLAKSDEAQQFFNETYRYMRANYKVIGVADMIPGSTKYTWGESAQTYKPSAQNFVLVMEKI